jgi:hypothetical protein
MRKSKHGGDVGSGGFVVDVGIHPVGTTPAGVPWANKFK